VQGKVGFNSYAANQVLTAANHNATIVQMTEAATVTLWDCTSSTIGDYVSLWGRNAEAMTLVPAAGDQFVKSDGTANGTGTNLALPATAGLKVTMVCSSENNWTAYTDYEKEASTLAVIASGATAMSGTAISANTCSSAVAVSATGVATTDTIIATPNAILSTVAGYGVTSAGALRIDVYPTANNVNFQLCNPTGASIDPDAITINWKVIR
jgi:hypothetical protein